MTYCPFHRGGLSFRRTCRRRRRRPCSRGELEAAADPPIAPRGAPSSAARAESPDASRTHASGRRRSSRGACAARRRRAAGATFAPASSWLWPLVPDLLLLAALVVRVGRELQLRPGDPHRSRSEQRRRFRPPRPVQRPCSTQNDAIGVFFECGASTMSTPSVRSCRPP
jgi:hypothetical protein